MKNLGQGKKEETKGEEAFFVTSKVSESGRIVRFSSASFSLSFIFKVTLSLLNSMFTLLYSEDF